jgi:2-polyprenyl-6-methoxyphenol hydroxylase-like FAD-dependent oxidoreductase
MDTVDVLIAGAGPTGLTLACDLARQGIAFRIVEREPRPQPGSRGFTLKPQSLSVFDDLGLAERIATEATIEQRTRFYFGPRQLFALDNRPARPTARRPYPNHVALPQWRTEAILRERLAELGGKVEFGLPVTAIDTDADGVIATLGNGETIQARYLVGTDGGRSTIRRALGVSFQGHSNQDSRAMVADVRIDGLDPADGVHLWLTPGGLLAARPIGEGGLWQLAGSLPPPTGRENDDPRDDRSMLQHELTTRTGRRDLRVTDIDWLSTWHFNLRMAERFRVGPVFLAGDAAHVHTPFGGHGMNTGIQDAYNLGWKLGLVLRGAAPDSLLDTYETERMPVARAILADSERQKSRLLTSTLVRPFLGPLLKAGFTRQILRTRNDHPRYPTGPLVGQGGGNPAADDRLPTGARLFDLFRGAHFTVLGPDLVSGLDPEYVRAHRRTSQKQYTVVRPDGYVALVAATPAAVRDYFTRLSGSRTTESVPARGH